MAHHAYLIGRGQSHLRRMQQEVHRQEDAAGRCHQRHGRNTPAQVRPAGLPAEFPPTDFHRLLPAQIARLIPLLGHDRVRLVQLLIHHLPQAFQMMTSSSSSMP